MERRSPVGRRFCFFLPGGGCLWKAGLVTSTDPYALTCASIVNLRDLGERSVSGGRTRPGQLLRSAELANPKVLTDPCIAGLAIGTVVDLRTVTETAGRPDQLPPGTAYVHADVLAGLPVHASSGQAQLMDNPAGFVDAFGGSDPVAQMHRTYQMLVSDPYAQAGYGDFVRMVGAGAGPLLVHCTAGKDRTGWAFAIVMSALGFDDDEVMGEYLAVGPAVAQMFAPLLEIVEQVGIDRSALEPMLQVRPEYLASALGQVRSDFGNFDGYLRVGLGLTDADLEKLRTRLLM